MTEDRERLHGLWIAGQQPRLGHLLFCHGNAGNVGGDRVPNAALLAVAGFDVLLFDYRSCGRSTGRPDEEGSYLDAHVALAALVARPSVDRERVFYLGESLGAATSIRDAARVHYAGHPHGADPGRLPDPAADQRAPRAVARASR